MSKKIINKQLTSGHIVWFETSGNIDLNKCNTALLNNGFSEQIEKKSTWLSFRYAWRKFSTPIRNNQGWLCRVISNTDTKEVIAVVKEDITGEHLTYSHNFAFIMEGTTNYEDLNFKCSCGHVFPNQVSNNCPACGIELPPIYEAINVSYAEDQNGSTVETRGIFTRDLMRTCDVIALASMGRPYFHPSYEGSRLQRLFQAVEDWGDKAIAIPLAPNKELPKLAFEALYTEISDIEATISDWSLSTRESTRQNRLEALSAVHSKFELYAGVLGEMATDIENKACEVREKMLAVVLGDTEKQTAKALAEAERNAKREEKLAQKIANEATKKAQLEAKLETLKAKLNK